MKDESHETHHVLTTEQFEAERKKLGNRVLRHPLHVSIFSSVFAYLSTAIGVGVASDPMIGVLLGGILGFAVFVICEFIFGPFPDPLRPLSTEGFKSLQELAEANPPVAAWVAEALEDGRTLRARDLWEAVEVDHRRRALESQHEAEQAEKAALLDLRNSARDTVMSRKTV